MPLWEWAVAAYARSGVEAACLRLQDAFGQNVPLLLWAAWARSDDPALIGKAADLARAWDQAAVQPLRAARRGLKAPVSPIPDAAREALRREVKAAELQAERLLMEALEQIAVPPTDLISVFEALAAAAQAWGGAVPDDALAALAAGLA